MVTVGVDVAVARNLLIDQVFLLVDSVLFSPVLDFLSFHGAHVVGRRGGGGVIQ